MRPILSWFHRLACGVVVMSAGAGCDSGGGGSSVLVSGTVLSPAGQPIGRMTSNGPRDADSSPRSPELTGLLPVPDGTVVELVRLDALGFTLESLATTTTAAGRYELDLSSLGLVLASDLAVTAGSGATRMRAAAVQSALDVDPTSEAALQVLLEQGVGLEPFTVEEARDLLFAVQLLVAARGLEAQADVAATVDLVRQSVLADPGLATFVAAAASPGQTTVGPGDVGDYFPAALGDAWGFAVELSIDAGEPEPSRRSRRVVESDELARTFAVEDQETAVGGDTFVTSYRETDTALVRLATDDPDQWLLEYVGTYDEARFPLRVGERWVQFDARDVPLGDHDGDGRLDFASLRSLREVVAFEPLQVRGETLEHCARIETVMTTAVRYSSASREVSTVEAVEWFAPGLGLVATDTDTFERTSHGNVRSEQTEALTGYQVGTAGRGVPPANALLVDLTRADSNEEEPGRPGIGFDGTNYLVVSCRESSGVMGAIVSPRGLMLQEFPIFGSVGFFCSPRAVVSFDGENYLVVFEFPGFSGSTDLVAVRISPVGDVLDPTGFSIGQSDDSNHGPAVVFDGANHLVVWSSWNQQSDIHGAFVAPDGTVSDEFVVHSAPGNQISPAIVQGDGQFLVAWVEQRLDSDVRGTRLSLAGEPLDPAGFDIAVTPESEDEPAVSFDGERYLVAWIWEPTRHLVGGNVRTARFELDGTPSDPEPLEVDASDSAQAPTVVFDGANHFVVWMQNGFSPRLGISAARIAPDGELLDGPGSEFGFPIDGPPRFGALGVPAMARGSSNCLLAWVGNHGRGGPLKDVAATQVYPPGR